ncbi:hypothetical protein BGZ97_011041 [Linnemannia gamsii]|uniref:Uncharacterized protein n=1 Tax=Linnemannia gamsii TaxID=64522 RepID=A0A9P6RNX0_9FUNG|nr:hypothetical protein BGZ97_011041 [Linnemannia gamsii]
MHTGTTMSDDLENLQRWVDNKPLLGLPRHTPPAVPSDSNTELVAQPFYFSVQSSGATGVDLWKDPANHADAAATVLTYSGKSVDFIPSLGLKGQADKFNAYIKKISTFPGFVIENSQETGENVTSQNVDTMIGQIKNAYVGFASADLDSIVASVEAMANSILNKSSKESDKSIFSQDTVSKTNNSTYITIFFTTLSMHENQQGKKTYIEQSYRIFRTLIRVNTTYLVTYAEKLDALIGDGGLPGWAAQGSSPTGSKLSCFEAAHKKAPREI